MTSTHPKGKLILFSAPSGAGKTTIVRALFRRMPGLRFSVSATTRSPRAGEVDGREYYFMGGEEFRQHVDNGDFIEYEEVYEGVFYGTLKREVDGLLEQGYNVVFDIDVMGGLNLKRVYGDRALGVFVMPPGIETLRQRLQKRGSESEATLEKRIEKATWELTFSGEFDVTVVNDELERAIAEVEALVIQFIRS